MRTYGQATSRARASPRPASCSRASPSCMGQGARWNPILIRQIFYIKRQRSPVQGRRMWDAGKTRPRCGVLIIDLLSRQLSGPIAMRGGEQACTRSAMPPSTKPCSTPRQPGRASVRPCGLPCSLAPASSRTPSWHLGADTRNNWSGYKEKRKKTSHEEDQLFVGDLTSCMSYHVR